MDIETRGIVYDPLPSQQEFHDSPARFKGFSGPIGSGKSQALCQEAIRLTYVNPGRLGLLGAPTYPMLRDATQATLVEILTQSQIPFDHNKAENTFLMGDTGSRILFRPVDEFERLRGTNLAWFGLDELTYTPEASWVRLEGRLRDPKANHLCGFAVWTPKGYDWVYHRFVAGGEQSGYYTTFAKPLENRFILQHTPDFYERLRSSYDENFYRQEVLGEYLNLDAGLVYSSFTRTENIREGEIDPALPLLWALDFNVDPMSSVVAQAKDSMIHVLDEIVIRHGTTRQACEEFLARFPRHPRGIHIYGDASGYAQQTTGTSDYDVIKEYFETNSPTPVHYKVPKSNPNVRDRVNLVNGMLRSAAGEIRLAVSAKCKELIRDFEEVCFKESGYQIDKDKDRLRTHLSDALGYLLSQEFRQRRPMGEQPRRLCR